MAVILRKSSDARQNCLSFSKGLQAAELLDDIDNVR